MSLDHAESVTHDPVGVVTELDSGPRRPPPARGGPMRLALQAFFTVYYRYTRLLTGLMPSVTIEGKRLALRPSLYKPLENEHRFREFVRPGERVCDLGCGCGVISVFCADVARSVVALDINQEAVDTTRENCAARGLTNVEARKSDMFSAADGLFDCICANPPFVEIPMSGEGFQWATSITVLDRLFRDGKRYLADGGRIVVLYPRNKRARLVAMAEPEGFVLVESKPVTPKSVMLWLTCALYAELFFDAHFFVFERRA